MIGTRIRVGMYHSGGYTAVNAEYQAIYDAYTTKPSAADAAIDDTMVTSWKGDSLWTKLDGLWVWANHTNEGGECLHNWKDPTGTKAVAYNSPVFTQWAHVEGNGTTQYIDLNWKPSTGVNFTQDNCSVIFGLTNLIQSNSMTDFGVYDGSHILLGNTIQHTGARIYHAVNSAAQAYNNEPEPVDKGDYYHTCRGISTTMVSLSSQFNVTTSAASSGRPTLNMYALAYNNNGSAANFCTRKQMFLAVGSLFSAADFANFWGAFETRQDAHGTGIIT